MGTPPLTVRGSVRPGPITPRVDLDSPRRRVIALGVRVGQVRRATGRELFIGQTTTPDPATDATPLYDVVAQSMGTYCHTIGNATTYRTQAEHTHPVCENTLLQVIDWHGSTYATACTMPTLAALTPLPPED